MNTPLRTVSLDVAHPASHEIRQPVTAWPIYAADEIGTHGRVTVIDDGECAHVAVPADFCRAGTPVQGDWLLLHADGSVTHRRGDLFEAEAHPLPRARSDAFRMPSRALPRLPG